MDGGEVMGVRDLSVEQVLAIFQDLTDKQRSILAADPRTAAWLPSLDQDLEALQTTSRGQSPVAEPPQARDYAAEGVECDRRVESGVQLVQLYFEAGLRRARLQGDTAALAQWQLARDYIFDEGVSFLRMAYAAQVEATRRVLRLARSGAISADLRAHSISGLTFLELLHQVERANTALEEHDNASRARAAEASRAQSLPNLFFLARKQALTNFTTLRRIASQVLSKEEHQAVFALAESFLERQS